MSAPRPLASLLAALALSAAACTHGAHLPDSMPAFYRAPMPIPGTEPGHVIRHEPLTGFAALEDAASNERVLYRSNAVAGDRPIAVSGIIALPKGRPPSGGWPIVSWAHGTVGVADACSPSRDVLGAAAHVFNQAPHRLLNLLLRNGYAVAMTDYEGLGTEGRHPFLLGDSEARGVLDIVRAARNLYPDVLSPRFAIVGHSQGGQAALFAGARAAERLAGSGLEAVGVIAYAPASDILGLFRLAMAQSQPFEGAAFIPLYFTGAAEGDPEHVRLDALLKDARARELYSQVDTRCRVELSQPDSWGGIDVKETVLAEGADTHALEAQLATMHPGTLTIPIPIRLVQGRLDTRVEPLQTLRVHAQLTQRGATIDYIGCPFADHFGVMGDDLPGTLGWLRQRFTGQPPDGKWEGSCQTLTAEELKSSAAVSPTP
ncbi:alpha/beta fold hydrolase [Myxococcus sp. K15C18031901]|uniref:lipase family protein n=1 Tax=Myxococcus dinghuensis TaxID=2906761 RepID=UPI0020A7F6E1|nr:lipase family protein [Myxococcus dinghuensis]MCP3097385.1 alpha/beta fold hydrolase [Myxococcus dinghuensis]